MTSPPARSHVTSHVLDAAAGAPAAGVHVRLERLVPGDPGDAAPDGAAGGWERVAEQVTDADGRATALGPERLEVGTYRLTFATGEWFAAAARETFYPQVVIVVDLVDPDQHHHVPLLLSPFAYTTYRGS